MRPDAMAVIGLLSLIACGDGAATDVDAGCPCDASSGDAAEADARTSADDAGARDGSPGDADIPDGATPDGAAPADAGPPDGAPPDAPTDLADHVHIDIDNFCNVSVEPEQYTVAAGQTLQLSYHNHSVDYEADVWLSYGGGYLELAQGATWDDPFTFCSGPSSYTAYADISIAGGPTSACPGFRLYIHCE